MLSRARRGTLSGWEWGLRTRSCLFLRSGGVMERAAERRDAEKRSMFPQQMGIIHAVRVAAALTAPRVSMLKMTHNAPFSPKCLEPPGFAGDCVRVFIFRGRSVPIKHAATFSLQSMKCVSWNSVQLMMSFCKCVFHCKLCFCGYISQTVVVAVSQ